MTGTAAVAWPPPPERTVPGLSRLLPPTRLDLTGHARVHGPLPYRGDGTLTEEVRAAGLTGRGGAAFPVAVKLAAVAAGAGPAVVAGNGAEGEPASGKDRHLLSWSPHLVLDGLQLAAEATGARRAVLYLHHGAQLQQELAEALADRALARCDRVPVQLVTAPPRFLAGEESALASRVNGGLAQPAFKRPRVFERGIGGAPTLVQNVETLAHLALIARYGAAWFRAVGTAAEPGSMLVTTHRADGWRAVGEVPLGVPLAAVLDLGRYPAQAVLTGGYHGTWLPAARAATLPLTAAALRGAGGVLGAGVLAALPPGQCGLTETARVLRYLATESAGQCGPCRSGLPRIAAAFTHLARLHPDPRTLPDLERWSGLVAGRGACHHPDGTVRLVRSALTTFAAETAAHTAGRCTAEPGQRAFLPLGGADGGPAAPPRSRRDWK